jgi:hypothetical protein
MVISCTTFTTATSPTIWLDRTANIDAVQATVESEFYFFALEICSTNIFQLSRFLT